MDLVLPGAVPVAELVPELARSVGLLDPATAHRGYRLVTRSGTVLAGHAALADQGVEDGAVITVATGVDEEPSRVYDDVVEAMADAVERDLEPWEAADARRTSLGAAVALIVLGAAALVTQRGPTTAAAATAALTAAVLLVAATVLSRVRGQTGAALCAAVVGCGCAAVAGLVAGGGAHLSGTPLAAAGAGALVAGLVAVLGLRRGRTLVLAPVLVGGVFLGAGLVARIWSERPAVVLTTVLTLVVASVGGFPWLALGATGTVVDPPFPTSGVADVAPVDAERVAADARTAHELLIGLSASLGVLLVLTSAPAVSLGPAGVVVSVLACAVVLLSTRQHHVGAEVLVGVTSGVLGLLSTAASVLWLHPTWRPAAAAVLLLGGVTLLALTVLPQVAEVRRGRLGDLLEGVALLALPPTLVVACGVVPALRG
jgi:type VII secretion integral membrane protein EccD